MIAYAAVDLHCGRVVQLVGGKPEAERVRLDDPTAVARRWEALGFAALHVVDLDAALGLGSNRALIDGILAGVRIPVQVGGGARSSAAVESLLDSGASRVVVGTRALEDRAWLERLSARHPYRLALAADVRDGLLVSHGWTASTGEHLEKRLEQLAELPLAAVLVTDVTREGSMRGIDPELFLRVCDAAAHPVLASGGIGSLADLARLRSVGAAGAVLGMALYTGVLDARAVARRFGR